MYTHRNSFYVALISWWVFITHTYTLHNHTYIYNMSVIKSWKKLFMRITQTQINDSALKITPSNKMCREIKTHAKCVNICINNWNTCLYTIESPIFSPNTYEHTKQFGCLWCAIMFAGKKKYTQITVRAIAYKQTSYSGAFD